MKNLDFGAWIILFFLGLGVCLKALTYPLGSLSSPGAGIFPILSSIFLMCLAGASIIYTLLKKEIGETYKRSFFSEKEAPKKVFWGIVTLVAFRYLFPVFGFALSTLFLILALTKILGHYSWKFSIFFSLLTAFMAYFLFQIGLKIPMPKGILGF